LGEQVGRRFEVRPNRRVQGTDEIEDLLPRRVVAHAGSASDGPCCRSRAYHRGGRSRLAPRHTAATRRPAPGARRPGEWPRPTRRSELVAQLAGERARDPVDDRELVRREVLAPGLVLADPDRVAGEAHAVAAD